MNLPDSLARLALRLGLGRRALASAEFVIVVAAAVAFARDAGRAGGALVIVAGGLALVRSRLARLPGRVTAVGALSEAVLDRAGEAVLCGGIALFFLRSGIAPERITTAVMLAITALVLVLLAAYVRARAEGLGIEASVGIPPVVARVVMLGFAPLALGTGARGALLVWMTLGLAIASGVTLVLRVAHVARAGVPRASSTAGRRDTLPGRRVQRKGN